MMKRQLKALISDTNPARLAYHRLKNSADAIKAGHPANNLIVIGITGTDGKTTTVSMLAHILRAEGIKVGAASTAFLELDGKREPNPTQKTSLTGKDTQAFLKRVVKEGCTHAIVEASSHGLLQGRLNGIKFDVAGITNTSPEHLDYHKTMDAYIKAKGILFKRLKKNGTKVLNGDDNSYGILTGIDSFRTIDYSPELQLSNIHSDVSSCSAILTVDAQQYDLTLSLPGTFNLENAMCAINCALALGIPIAKSVNALKTFVGAPGRMQRIDAGQPYAVYIDFTVTPVAYERTLTSLRQSLKPGGRILVLTGSCGDRMHEKRPMVGKVCSTLADIVVVTNEDPYTEDPERIIDEVLSGIESMPIYRSADEVRQASGARYCLRLSDRLEAIRFLISRAKPQDLLLFSGKGGDVTMMTNKGQIPWDEAKILRNEIQAHVSSST